MNGAFLMSREIFNHDVFTDIKKFRIFFWIIGHAVFSEKGLVKGGVRINRGQYLRSYRNLREDLVYFENNAEKRYSTSTIKDKVEELVEEGSILIEETKHGTLFTVVNYEHYQGFERYKTTESEVAPNSNRTPTEHLPNSNRTATEQQPNNKNLDIKDIKDNKEIKDINALKDLSTTATTEQPAQDSMSADDYKKRLLSRFVELRAHGFDHSPKDELAAEEIKKSGVPIEDAIKTMEDVYSNYKPRHSRDRINALSYCVGPILDKHVPPEPLPSGSNNYQPRKYGSKPIREEVRPDWLGKPEDKRVPETVPPANSQLEEEKQKLLAKLAARKERGHEGD